MRKLGLIILVVLVLILALLLVLPNMIGGSSSGSDSSDSLMRQFSRMTVVSEGSRMARSSSHHVRSGSMFDFLCGMITMLPSRSRMTASIRSLSVSP